MEHHPPFKLMGEIERQFLHDEFIPKIKQHSNDYGKSGAKTAKEVFGIAMGILDANLQYKRSDFYKKLSKTEHKQKLIKDKFQDIVGYILSDNYTLIRKIRRDDRKTLKDLYSNCQPKIEAMVRNSSLKEGGIADIFQEGLIKLIEKTRQAHFHLNANTKICTYLYSLCQRHLANKLKKGFEQHETNQFDNPDFWINEFELSSHIMFDTTRLNETQKEQLQEIILAIEKLGESCQTILTDRLLEEYPFKELAEKHNLTLGAAKMRVRRCWKRLEIFLVSKNDVVRLMIL